MKRFAVIALVVLLWSPDPVVAESGVAKPVVKLVEEQGYAVTEISRTWLGRILITAQNDDYLREVVLNRTTGQIIRDRVFPLGKQKSGGAPVQGTARTPGDAVDDALDSAGDAIDGATGEVDAGVGGVGGVGGGVGGVGGGVGGGAGIGQ